MRTREIVLFAIALLLWAVVLFCALALFSYSNRDIAFLYDTDSTRTISNFCGPFGAWFAYGLLKYFGYAAYLILVVPAAFGVAMFRRIEINGVYMRLYGSLFAIVSIACLLSITLDKWLDPIAFNLPIAFGGLVGQNFGIFLVRTFGLVGAYLVLLLVMIISLVVATNMWLYEISRDYVMKQLKRGGKQKTPSSSPEIGGRFADTSNLALTTPPIQKEEQRNAIVDPLSPSPVQSEPDLDEEQEPELFPTAPVAQPAQIKKEDEPVEKAKPKRKSPKPESANGSEYILPPMKLFEPAIGKPKDFTVQIQAQARLIEQCLTDFGVEGKVVSWEVGPVVTMFEVQLSPGIKVSSVASLSDNLAMALKAQSLRIVAPIPGKSTVGIETPNPESQVVNFRDITENPIFDPNKYRLPFLLGKQGAGEPLVADLTKMPHALIAGATGSGKSVCLNALIMTLLAYKYPWEVKLILIDPKMVELSFYKDVPHLLAPVVTDMRQAPGVLDWAVNEMESRYRLFNRVGVRDIVGYNKLGAAGIDAIITGPEEREDFPDYIPYIVVVVDELADLMMIAKKEIEWSITRLAQKSRAIGIHIVLATQRPSVNVITGLIKANMPCRISFQVSSKVDSRTIIDQNGADKLLGRGDMLFMPPTSPKLIRAQGVYVSDDEMKRVLEFIRAQAEPEYDPSLQKAATRSSDAHKGSSSRPSSHEGGGVTATKRKSYTEDDGDELFDEEGISEDGYDELFDDAVRVVLEEQRGSVSLLQRRLTVGYGRASRLIDQMEKAGILGEYRGSKPREILLTLEEWEAGNRGKSSGESPQ